MRRSICYCEPQVARAGQVGTWKFHYTTATSLPKGAKLKFDIRSLGRDIDWEVPSAKIEDGANVIWAYLESGEKITCKEIKVPNTIVPQFEFTLPAGVKSGGTVVLVMGAGPKSTDSKPEEVGTMAQLTTQRRRTFFLYVDTKGKGNYDEPELFSMDIRGAQLASIRVLAPSFVAKNKRFDITVRFEDEFGNLTNFAPEGTLIDLSYEHLRENLNWKLFIPETGFVILPNLYLNEAGIYRVQLRNLKTKELFTSSPIKCFQENNHNLLWGQLHGESERIDSTENIENCLRHFRDDKAFNFFASSSFDAVEESSNEIWKQVSQNIADFNEEDRFVTILGFQYRGEKEKEGTRQLLYFKDNKPILRQKENKSSTLAKLYRGVLAKELISIPSFTMGDKYGYDFQEFYPEFERVVEIYNAWGCSECTKAEGNPFPITGFLEENKAGSLQTALKNNRRFGFVAGGLDDRGIYTELYDSEQVQYSPGLTAVICEKYTREALMEALYRRNCYATTGARIIMGFFIAGKMMGSELSTAKKPGLAINRHLSGYVATTEPIEKIEIVRNGKVIHTFQPQGHQYDYAYDDMDPLEKILIRQSADADGKNAPPFIYYYLRVKQVDGQMAWSSPIWIDQESPQPASQETKPENKPDSKSKGKGS